MKFFLLFLSIFFTSLVVSQNNFSTVEEGKRIQDFIPKGWEKITECKGDLNNDKADDIAFIIEEKDKKKFILNQQGLGQDTLNINPRKLIIIFKNGSAYKLADVNNTFIPLSNDIENSCLMDPLADGEIKIEKGKFKISLNYWYSCGSWYTTIKTFTFKFRDNHFFLIGFDSYQFHRSTGEVTEESRNYLTKKQSSSSGGNQFSDGKEKIKTIWSKIKLDHLTKLKDLNSESIYDF